MFRQINKENAFDEILNQIIENIRAGRLKKGDALRQNVQWQKQWEFQDRL